MFSIGVDIGGSHITACMYEHAASRLNRETLVYRKVDTGAGKAEIIGHWVRAVSECLDKGNTAIRGIGIAIPGPFDYYNGISLIEGVGKLQALYGVSIRLELAEKLQMAPSQIRFINDATAFSIAETMIGRASGYRRTVAITLGTGLGSSFLIGGKPVIRDKMVPEGGFLYNKYYGNEIADNVFSARGIINLYKTLSGKETPNVRTLYEQVNKDPYARQTFTEFGKNLGEFLLPYLSGFSAGVLVLGGNIARAFPHFGPALTDRLPETEVYVSEFGEEAAIIGSALLIDDTYYNAVKPTIKLM
ncbi:ROK family protein [Sinomicrobium kalidii]|uniref:ROK family protein n=1 Tax=Sinomicrobium kalidii TaxID=2900738 RepID=UPI001E363A00|nr:ROK family protein [Sinomicrobium kalidii]UGU17211.1 ROK family protein [Sinomicrobium kalidii]